MKNKMPQLLLLLNILLIFPTFIQSCNLVITPTSSHAISTDQPPGGLATRNLSSSSTDVIGHHLPPDIESLDDITIVRKKGNDGMFFIFAMSARSRQICSYLLDESSSPDEDGTLDLINCVGDGTISMAPFSGISSWDSDDDNDAPLIVVSGGTGGLSIFRYDASNGRINDMPPLISNLELPGVVGHPDVKMIRSDVMALSTDFSSGGSDGRFGTMIASIVGVGEDVDVLREYRIPNSLGFALSLGPANFPLVSAPYNNDDEVGDDALYLYTANGSMTVQKPLVDDVINVLPQSGEGYDDFVALTVAARSELKIVVFGGLTNNGSDTSKSTIIVFDASEDPLKPTIVMTKVVVGRLTSLDISAGVGEKGNIAFVSNDGAMIGSVDIASATSGGKDIVEETSGYSEKHQNKSFTMLNQLILCLVIIISQVLL